MSILVLALPACGGSPSSDDGSVAPAADAASLDGPLPFDGPAAPDADVGGADASPWSCTAPWERPSWSPPADDGVALDAILEAAGYAAAASSDWVGVAAGNLCGGSEAELVLVKNAHSFFSILRGPAPVAVGSGDLSSDAAHPWRAVAAGDLDGDGRDEVVGVRHVTAAGVADVVVARANDACALGELASATIGSVANSDWAGVAIGDFDGDGDREIAAVKNAHTSFVFLRLEGTTLSTWHGADLGSDAALPWRGVAAGDLDGDGRDELIAARSVSDGASATVVAWRWNGTSFIEVAASTLGNAGNSAWEGITAGDFDGDGRGAVVLAKDAHSRFLVLGLAPGASVLSSVRASDFVSAAGQPWRGLAAIDWLGGDSGAEELVSARAATGAYRTDLVISGSAFHRTPRDSALAGTEAQYAGEPRADASTPADLETLKGWLTETHATVYSFLLYDTTGQDYLDFVRFLDATKDFCVDGRQLRVWLTLIPPTEHISGRCSRPAESPLTSWAEADDFAGGLGEAGCEDYLAWASVLGRLAAEYPHFVALNIDDFSHNVDTTFTPEVIAGMESRLRSQAPWFSLVPTLYYQQGGTPCPTRWPDLGLTLDSILFYFRNESEGEGPCAACDTPGTCTVACLASTCAEATVDNAPGEIATMATMLPAGRSLHVGAYFTGHSACGTPTPKYDYDLFETALAQPRVTGVTVYTTQHPAIECTDDNYLTDKGCVVARVFSHH